MSVRAGNQVTITLMRGMSVRAGNEHLDALALDLGEGALLFLSFLEADFLSALGVLLLEDTLTLDQRRLQEV